MLIKYYFLSLASFLLLYSCEEAVTIVPEDTKEGILLPDSPPTDSNGENGPDAPHRPNLPPHHNIDQGAKPDSGLPPLDPQFPSYNPGKPDDLPKPPSENKHAWDFYTKKATASVTIFDHLWHERERNLALVEERGDNNSRVGIAREQWQEWLKAIKGKDDELGLDDFKFIFDYHSMSFRLERRVDYIYKIYQGDNVELPFGMNDYSDYVEYNNKTGELWFPIAMLSTDRYRVRLGDEIAKIYVYSRFDDTMPISYFSLRI